MTRLGPVIPARESGLPCHRDALVSSAPFALAADETAPGAARAGCGARHGRGPVLGQAPASCPRPHRLPVPRRRCGAWPAGLLLLSWEAVSSCAVLGVEGGCLVGRGVPGVGQLRPPALQHLHTVTVEALRQLVPRPSAAVLPSLPHLFRFRSTLTACWSHATHTLEGAAWQVAGSLSEDELAFFKAANDLD